jgi:hypothetical protein
LLGEDIAFDASLADGEGGTGRAVGDIAYRCAERSLRIQLVFVCTKGARGGGGAGEAVGDRTGKGAGAVDESIILHAGLASAVDALFTVVIAAIGG